MFTGIVQDVGEIVGLDKQGDWTLTVAVQTLPLDPMPSGASIACNGICLTVIEKAKGQFKVQISAETLSKTTALHWRLGTRINLEPSLRVGDELGGHFVMGHVDGIAKLMAKEKEGESFRCTFEVPRAFAKFLAPKGSIALDGVSLTVNEADGARFGVNIIPHTQSITAFSALEPGAEVNFEVDTMARYAERLLHQRITL